MRQSARPQHSAPVPGWRRLLYQGEKRGSAFSGGAADAEAQTSAPRAKPALHRLEPNRFALAPALDVPALTRAGFAKCPRRVA